MLHVWVRGSRFALALAAALLLATTQMAIITSGGKTASWLSITRPFGLIIQKPGHIQIPINWRQAPGAVVPVHTTVPS